MKKLLMLGLFSVSAWSQDYIRIGLLAPTVPLDWTTPRTLFKSAYKNRWEGGKRPFGHVYTEIKCEKHQLTTSVRAKNFNPVSEFVKGGRGLGILYHTYEGELESGSDLEREVADLQKESKLMYIEYKINADQCARMIAYYDDYKKLNVARSYGLPHRPLFAEGGTDAAYAVSFLDVAGILNEKDREEWWNQVNIPLEYSGPPIEDETANFIRVLFGAKLWATENERHKKLQFYDLQKMMMWVLREKNAQRLICAEKRNGFGVCLDASHLRVKQGPLWQQHTDPMYQPKPKKP